MVMAIAGFSIGLITFVAGILILTLKPSTSDIKTLITQTSNLAQKGIAEDISGLVGNASVLLEAMSDLVRTTSGVGVFLSILGTILMLGSAWLAWQLTKMNPTLF
jgi:uncharacterized membrane protein